MRIKKYFLILTIVFSNIAIADDDFWIDMERAEPGQIVRTEWKGMQIAVLYRNTEMIDTLNAKYKEKYINPKEIFRSEKPQYFVFFDKCLTSGDRLEYIKGGSNPGLLDVTENLLFDYSGRSDQGQEINIPRYIFVSETKMVFHSD